jgi:formiminotetrahydrofolate cyclodeaminase
VDADLWQPATAQSRLSSPPVKGARNDGESRTQLPLLDLSTRALLEKFGAGGHKPGSGSAAALLGLVSCQLLKTVVRLTDGRGKYLEAQPQLSLANQQVVSDVEPALFAAFQQDAIQFDRVVHLRRERDAESDPRRKRQLGDKAPAELRRATEIPLDIARHCIDLAEKARTVFDLGFASARGDSGVAISAAIAAAYGALFVVSLNLTSFRGSDWARRIRKDAAEQLTRLSLLQPELVRRLDDLQNATAATDSTRSRSGLAGQSVHSSRATDPGLSRSTD